MLVLAFDCTMAACSVAVWRDGATLAARRETMERGQAEALMPLIAATMMAAQADFAQVSRVAVTVGPGSFTGVRVGLAAARGFGLALRVPVVGATTGEVLTYDAARAGTVISVVDTKRGDVYVEAFAADGARLAEAQTVPAAEIDGWISRHAWPRPVMFVGDAAAALAETIGAETVSLDAQPVPRVFPDPTLLAKIAAHRMPTADGPLPLYVQPPAATISTP